MKNILALSLLALSFNTFAARSAPIEVPYPTHQEAYYGTIKRVESEVKSKLMEKALQFCGTKENLALVSDVEVRFSFDMIEEDNVIFEGSYPLAAATGVAHCRD